MGTLSASGTSRREDIALAKPAKARLARFPRFMLRPTKQLFRAHQKMNGPWWFSSNGSGRFDLTGSKGTCYLADSAAAALREALGAPLVTAGVIDLTELEGRVISVLTVENPLSLADTTSTKAANHGITKEISTVGYAVPQAWAKAWAAEGMDGVRYAGRFSTAHKDRCYALFGPAGASPALADPAPQPAAKVAEKAGIRIVSRPASVTIVQPPS
jgi:hypothetical protein